MSDQRAETCEDDFADLLTRANREIVIEEGTSHDKWFREC